MKKKAVKKPQITQLADSMFRMACPECGMTIHTQATVERFNEPPNWSFWGRPDARWIRCEGESGGQKFIHFCAYYNGQYNERIAWLRPEVSYAEARQETLL